MGQFLDYLASVFSASRVEGPKEKANHVTFADGSFSQVFNRSESNESKSLRLASTIQKNNRTLFLYQTIGTVAFLIQLSMVTVPKIKRDSFDFMQPEGWQTVTLGLVPFVVFLASISAMYEVNKPVSETTKLSSKSPNLNLNQNQFIHSLKVLIILIALCQVSSVFSEHLIWSVVMIVPIWCSILTMKLAQNECKLYLPSPKKNWVKLNLSGSSSPNQKSPTRKPAQSPVKQSTMNQEEVQARATPRTRTKRAVKNIINGVSDKYHAFEQNVAQQISQRVFNPASPKSKMIEF